MKKKLSTIILLVVTIFLIISVIYISILLRDQGDSSVTKIKKTKAASLTYSRTLSIGSETIDITPTVTEPQPTNLSPTRELTPTETSTPTVQTEEKIQPPTEAVLAYRNPTITIVVTPTEGADLTSFPKPTTSSQSVNNLPQSGWAQYSIIFFVGAVLMIFVSFLY